MNRDRIVGAAKQAKGAFKEAAGKAFGYARLVVEGRMEIAEGMVQSAVGSYRDTFKR
jgi:uncharacterized protein YjbJ (UPF0337 family)